MEAARSHATATLLPNGKVLVAGGYEASAGPMTQNVASAELYDPTTGTFTPTGSMKIARSDAAAALLTNGKVLILGGEGCKSNPLCNMLQWTGPVVLSSAELFDPATGRFTSTGSMSQPCYACRVTVLPDGRVLALSGLSNAVEAYDPATGRFARVGKLSNEYTSIAVFPSLLPTGKVLVVGDGLSGPEAEVFDPATGASRAIPFSVPAPATDHYRVESATPLGDGQVLVQVAVKPTTPERRTYLSIFNPSTETFTDAGTIDLAQWSAAGAVLLPDGRVLLVSDSRDPSGEEVLQPATGVFDPVSGFHVIDAKMIQGRGGQTMTLLPDGTVLIAGGDVALLVVPSAELFVP